MVGVSIIVPVYNVEGLVGRCLDSLVNQTFDNFEVIVVNDGSTDNSMSIVEDFKRRFPNLINIHNQLNQGLSVTRNNALEFCSGKYIYYIDSDDYIHPDTIQTMYQVAESTGVDYVIDGFKTVTENGGFLASYPVDFTPFNIALDTKSHKDLFLIHNSVWNRLYLKSIIQDNHISFFPDVWYEDLLFTRQYYYYSEKFVIIDSQFLSYVQREGSLMSSMSSNKNMDIITVFSELIDFYKEKGVYEDFEREIQFLAVEHIYIAAIVRASRSKNWELAEQIRENFVMLFPSIGYNPLLKSIPFKHKILKKLVDFRLYKVIDLLFV